MKETLIVRSKHRGPFLDRAEAGEMIGQELKKLPHKDPVVLGIPRGGLVIAREIARALNADIDIVLTHKLSAPGNRELAIGALDEHGDVILNENMREYCHADDSYIQAEKDRQIAEIARRKEIIRKIHEKIDLKNKTVILTDDGAATGATMQAAVWAVRKEEPWKIIVALPVASETALHKLSADADQVLCLYAPEQFYALSQFYSYFEQVEDAEVLEILKESQRTKDDR